MSTIPLTSTKWSLMAYKRYARPYRGRSRIGQMNNTEREYSRHLELLKRVGQISDYSFEPETLRIGQDCRYTPDFRVVANVPQEGLINATESHIEFHEVKGTTRRKNGTGTIPYVEDDALVKIKAAAELHPYKFIMVWKGTNGHWEKREIN